MSQKAIAEGAATTVSLGNVQELVHLWCRRLELAPRSGEVGYRLLAELSLRYPTTQQRGTAGHHQQQPHHRLEGASVLSGPPRRQVEGGRSGGRLLTWPAAGARGCSTPRPGRLRQPGRPKAGTAARGGIAGYCEAGSEGRGLRWGRSRAAGSGTACSGWASASSRGRDYPRLARQPRAG